jgi:hypothetical protein
LPGAGYAGAGDAHRQVIGDRMSAYIRCDIKGPGEIGSPFPFHHSPL